VRVLEILVAGDKVLRWGFRRKQIKKHAISGITDGGRTRDGDDQIGLDSKVGQKRCGRDRRVGEVSLDGRSAEHVLQFSLCAGGLVTDISPDTMMLVSRTTRTWRSDRRDLCGNLLRGEGG